MTWVTVVLVEAAQIEVRYDPGFRKEYLHRCHQNPKGVAKVAAARKLAVRLYLDATHASGLSRGSQRQKLRGWPWSAQASR
ncbi:MAG: hypothetical protein WA628_08135 [Terriglobales bacterium]